MTPVKEKEKKAFEVLKGNFHYTNVMQSPRLSKVVISSGVGSAKDKNRHEVVKDRLAKITGQVPAARRAKKAVATFKTRQGDVIGYQVTLRGKRMYDFMDRLINVGFPRTRDFRGLPKTAVDEMGNYTIGLKEHIIFPETTDEELKDVFGFAATIVTTAKGKEEALAFLEHLGVPFKK